MSVYIVGRGMSMKSSRSNPDKPKLLDEFHDVMRRRHYSIHTERSYADWIKRYIHFYKMQERQELLEDKDRKVEDFYLILRFMVKWPRQRRTRH